MQLSLKGVDPSKNVSDFRHCDQRIGEGSGYPSQAAPAGERTAAEVGAML